MKNNLVKLLALGGMVFALTACPGPKDEPTPTPGPDPVPAPVEVTFAELFELDSEANWALLGKDVIVKEVAVQGQYGSTLIGGGALGQYISDLIGLEIQPKEMPVWQNESRVAPGWGANITVTGKVTDVNGRLVIADADVQVVSERTYTSSGYTGGLPISYCPESILDRSVWSGSLLRQMSGGYFPGYFQIASLPQEISATEAQSFEVVFPGEDTDAEDLDNESLITVQIPEGLSQAAVDSFNAFFFTEGHEAAVGDYINVDSVLQYDRVANAGMGYVLTDFAELKTVPVADRPTIANDWAGVKSHFEANFNQAFLELETSVPFSYVLSDEWLDRDFKEYWKEEYRDELVPIDNSDKCATAVFTANFKPSKWEDFVGGIEELLAGTEEAPGDWNEIGDYWQDAGIIIFVKKDNKQQLLMQYLSDSAFEMFYTAPRLVTDEDFADVSLASAAYNLRVSELLGASFATALPNVSNQAIASVNFDWKNELYYYNKYNVGAFEYTFEISFAEGVTDEQISALAQGYEQAVLGAGFVEAYQSDFGITGLWNATTGEFLLQMAITADKTLYLDVMVLRGAMASHVALKPASNTEMVAMINGEYAGWNGASAQYFPTTTSSVTSFDLGDKSPVGFDFLDTSKDEMSAGTGYTPYFVASMTYAADLTAEDVALFVAALTAAGFVAATHSVHGAGYWNASTYEFITVAYSGKILSVGFGLVAAPVASSVVTVATPAGN